MHDIATVVVDLNIRKTGELDEARPKRSSDLIESLLKSAETDLHHLKMNF